MSNQKINMKEISQVLKTGEGVKVEISSTDENTEKSVQKMVENCATGQCDCMPPEIKEKVSGMEFRKTNGKPAIFIKGKISVEDMELTIDRSCKDDSCC